MATATATATSAGREVPTEALARQYETIYILRSDVAPQDANRLATRVREIIEGMGGKLLKVDNWGRRRLAYPIHKTTRGVFVYLSYVGAGPLVAELERNLRLLDVVVRHQTVVTQTAVRIEDYEVDEAELEFRELEVVEEEPEPELAQRLGLVERPRPGSSDESEASGSSDSSSSSEGEEGARAEGSDANKEESDSKGGSSSEEGAADKESQS